MENDAAVPIATEEGTPLFFIRLPAALGPYLALRDKLLAFGPDVEIAVQKTQITFRARRVFACASLPRTQKVKPGACLLVTFGLPYRLDSPRVFQAVEPYPNRWTHHVLISSAVELDAELLTWLRLACDFSRGKR